MGSYVVQPGESWASIAGKIYGNQRWLIELAKVNGGINRILQPGQTIDAPDFDLSQTPVITADQWAGVPTGMTGNQTNYGNAQPAPAVPSFAPPAVPSFGGGGSTNAARAGESEASRAQNYAKPYNQYTASGITPGSAMANQLNRPITGQSYGADKMAGIPSAARPNAAQPNPLAGGISGVNKKQGINPTGLPPITTYTQPATGRANQASSARLNGQAASYGKGNQSQGAGASPAPPASGPSVNTATPAPPPTPASDMSNIAWAARYTGLAIYEYGKTGKVSQLPIRINARVAAELPFRGAGFNSTEEFMAALGYRVDPDGNWQLYNPVVKTAYRPQTYSGGGTYSPSGGGGGYGGGGYTRGPVAQGYGSGGSGLVNWRISG